MCVRQSSNGQSEIILRFWLDVMLELNFNRSQFFPRETVLDATRNNTSTLIIMAMEPVKSVIHKNVEGKITEH